MVVRRTLFFLSFVSVVAYGGLLIWKASFAVGGSDSSGYANEAKRIAEGQVVQPIAVLGRLELPDRFDRLFMPLAHEPGPKPRTMVPLYPPGFPLHLAAAGILWGWQYAPHFVSPFAALFLVLATYFLARELELSRLLALVAASILGGCAVLLYQASQTMSDVVAALWATAAVVFALRSRKRDIWAALAGASFGLAVLVRPTNAVLALPLLLALPWRWKAFAFFGGGGAPFALFEARWNSTVYGGAVRTGYSGIPAFALANFPARFTHYVRTIAQMFSPLVPLGWLAVAADRRLSMRDRALLFVWFAPYLLTYCFWGPYETWWYTRFLIPAFPALVVGAVLVARDLLRWVREAGPGPLRSPGAAIAIACAFFLVVADAERRGIVRWKPLEFAEGEQTYPMACDLARSKLPDRSLVVSMEMSGALRYYTDLQPVRWDWLQPGDFAQLRQKAAEKEYAIYALLAPFEEEKGALTERAPGTWKLLARVRDVKLWQLE